MGRAPGWTPVKRSAPLIKAQHRDATSQMLRARPGTAPSLAFFVVACLLVLAAETGASVSPGKGEVRPSSPGERVSFTVYEAGPALEKSLLTSLAQELEDVGGSLAIDGVAVDERHGRGDTPALKGELGKPRIPVYRYLIAVPHGASLKLAVTFDEEVVVDLDHELPPMQPLPPTSGAGAAAAQIKDEALYSSDEPYPAQLARVVYRGVMRDLDVATVEVAPLRYRPASRSLVITTGLEVVLDCNGGVPFSELVLEPLQMPLYRALVSNIDAVEADATIALPRSKSLPTDPLGADILVIYKNWYLQAIMPLIAHREDQGYLVENVDIDDIYQPEDDEDWERVDRLKNYLAGVMNPVTGWKPRPSYVLLVGDAPDITPASFLGTYPTDPYGQTGWSDYPFACVVGADSFADLSIGRLSASSVGEVESQVSKILLYESSQQADTAVAGAGEEAAGDLEQIGNTQVGQLLAPAGLASQTAYHGTDHADHQTFISVFNGEGDPATGKDYSPGTGVITVNTHGTHDEWLDLLRSANVNDTELENRSYFPIAFISACNCGRFELEDCIQERLQAIHGGTVANVGSSTSSSFEHSGQLLNVAIQAILGVELATTDPVYPHCLISEGVGCIPELGLALTVAKNRFLTFHADDPNPWNVTENVRQYNLLGDPALHTHYCEPLDTVYVDFGYVGIELGTLEQPYSILSRGINAVPVGGTVVLKNSYGVSDSSEAFPDADAITKQCTIDVLSGQGPLRIGVGP